MKQRTLEAWNAALAEKHGDRYTMTYLPPKATEKSEFSCNLHGKFTQLATLLLNRGTGCKGCSALIPRKLKHSGESELEKASANLPGMQFRYLETYSGSRTPTEGVCPAHGPFTREIRHLVSASPRGCPACMAEFASTMVKFSDYVSRARAVHGDTYDYVAEDYTGASGKVGIICKVHGKSVITSYGHLSGSGCAACGILKRSETYRVKFDEFVARARTVHGDTYDYVESSYSSITCPVTIVCKEHGEFVQSASDHVHSRSGCPECGKSAAATANMVDFEEFVERAEATHGNKYSYDRPSYSGIASKISISCATHGQFSQRATDHADGYGCPSCGGAVSSGETELADYVESLGVEVLRNYRYSGRREFDVFIPSANLAIEYDGLAWHSTRFRSRGEQLRKREDAAALGVTLIRIFEDEWLHRNTQVKALIANRLGKSPTKVYARACKVVPVTVEEARAFHEANHIQGWKRSGTSLGLVGPKGLVCVMTFTTQLSSRMVEEGAHELIRFSSCVSVIGGASRLLKHYIASARPTSVISYSDKRVFSGGMYSSLGFRQAHTSAPDYTYWKVGSLYRKHKSLFKREHLPAILGDAFDPSLSERENCERNGYYQVFDDGKLRWELTV